MTPLGDKWRPLGDLPGADLGLNREVGVPPRNRKGSDASRRRATSIASSILCIAMTLIAPAATSSPSSDPKEPPGSWSATLPEASLTSRALDDLRASLSSGHLVSGLTALAEFADVPIQRSPKVEGTRGSGLPGSVAIPPTVAARIQDLATVVSLAKTRIELSHRPTRAPLSFGLRLPSPPGISSRATHLEPLISFDSAQVKANVGRGASLQTALSIAAAVDRLLPSLVSMNRHAKKGAAPGCDVLDQLPHLCIGGSGDNVYEDDAEVLIDTGGNDTYLNSAGGADPVSGNGLTISVLVDSGGDDRYLAKAPVSSGSRVAQGAGADGGIGFLVDTDGNDRYDMRVAPDARTPASLGAMGQGSVHGSGFGLLADLAGDDSYSLRSPNPDGALGAMGQGAASGTGVGVLLDQSGDDAYEATSRSVAPYATKGLKTPLEGRAVSGGAGVVGGLGLLSDLAGTDVFTLESNKSIPLEPDFFEIAGSSAIGFGAGSGTGSIGVMLVGSGDTKAIAEASMAMKGPEFEHGAGAAAMAFGVGAGGAGYFQDSGGNDEYALKASSVGKDRSWGSAGTFGMGAGVLGTGFLEDAGGNDRYTSTVDSHGYAASGAVSYVQGVGVQGAGMLLDRDGDDLYDSTTRGEINKYIDSSLWQDGGASSGVQAFGYLGAGGLWDLGGSDSYGTANSFWIDGRKFSKNPLKDEMNAASFAQASVSTGAATLVDADRGSTDSFRDLPQNPPCIGTRGDATWRDCGDVYGEGSVRDTP